MSTVDGICRCDICKQEISKTDLFIEKSFAFEEDRHVCFRCADDYKKRTGEPKVVSYGQVHEYVTENRNRFGKNVSSADNVLDELLKGN